MATPLDFVGLNTLIKKTKDTQQENTVNNVKSKNIQANLFKSSITETFGTQFEIKQRPRK